MEKLQKDFYIRSTLEVARDLIGKILVHNINGKELCLKITETEAYIGAIDKACHAYGGKITERTKTLYEQGGISYVYLIYGMYCCFNVITEEKGKASGVLIRGGVPFKEENEISLLRYSKPYSELSKQKIKNLANGPGKLCLAMGIDKSLNEKSIISDDFYIADPHIDVGEIKTGKRINIDYAQEAVDFPWRFYI